MVLPTQAEASGLGSASGFGVQFWLQLSLWKLRQVTLSLSALFPHWLNEDSNTCPAYSPGLLRIKGNSSVKAMLADSCYLVNVPRSVGYTTKQPFCLLEMLLTEELEYIGIPLWQSPCPFPQLTESQSHGPTMPIQCQMNHSIRLPLLSADITNRLQHFLLSLNGRGLRLLLNTTL